MWVKKKKNRVYEEEKEEVVWVTRQIYLGSVSFKGDKVH